MPDIGGLILASATGSGLGGAMALAAWERETVLEHLVDIARAAGLDPIVVVLGPRSDDVLAVVDLGEVTIVIDPDWREGRAADLRSGLDTMSRFLEVETAVLIELDRPTITSDVVAAVAAGPRTAPAPVTVPKYRYARSGAHRRGQLALAAPHGPRGRSRSPGPRRSTSWLGQRGARG